MAAPALFELLSTDSKDSALAPATVVHNLSHTPFYTLRPGLLDYAAALELQQRLLAQRQQLDADLLLLLEHPPVITCGRGSDERHLLVSAEQLSRQGIGLHKVSRGGDMTFHGPGQLVGYPIVRLPEGERDLHRYLRRLEQLLQRTVARFGVCAGTLPGKTGLWVGERKLASIGVGVRHWTTWHGFALNVSNQLEGFANIVPCGLSGVRMTSLEECLQASVSLPTVESAIIEAFSELFDAEYLGEYVDPTTT